MARNFPEAEAALKTESLIMALERAMTVISIYAKASAANRRKSQPANAMPATNALRHVLHPHPDQTWREPTDAVMMSDPHQLAEKERDQTFIHDFESTPSTQQSVSLARMILELTHKVDRLQDSIAQQRTSSHQPASTAASTDDLRSPAPSQSAPSQLAASVASLSPRSLTNYHNLEA